MKIFPRVYVIFENKLLDKVITSYLVYAQIVALTGFFYFHPNKCWRLHLVYVEIVTYNFSMLLFIWPHFLPSKQVWSVYLKIYNTVSINQQMASIYSESLNKAFNHPFEPLQQRQKKTILTNWPLLLRALGPFVDLTWQMNICCYRDSKSSISITVKKIYVRYYLPLDGSVWHYSV